MIAAIQRVSQASVSVEGHIVGRIGSGLLVLLGIGQEDGPQDTTYLAQKITNMRIFVDDQGKMNNSVKDDQGEILLVSQFTLLADTKKGNRPSFVAAAPPEQAVPLYEAIQSELGAALGQPVATGEFGADMQVSLVNDGPVTIVLNSKRR